MKKNLPVKKITQSKMSLTDFEKYMFKKLNNESGKKLAKSEKEVKKKWKKLLSRLKIMEKFRSEDLN